MSELYRDFIDKKADEIITDLGGTITPAPANTELYRDFLGRKFDDVITALNSSITPAPAGDELYRDFIERKFDDVIAGIGGYVPPVTFPTLTGSIVTFNSQYAGLPLKSHTVDIDSVSGVSVINIIGTGKNLFDISILNQGDVRVTDGIARGLASAFEALGTIPLILPSGCIFSFDVRNIGTNITDTRGLTVQLIYEDDTNVRQNILNSTTSFTTFSIVTTKSVKGIFIGFGSGGDNIWELKNMQFEVGTTSTTYEAYNGTTTTINIGQTVNEATYNARTGALEVTQPSVQTIQLPPCPIDTLQGVNNIWADTGDTTLQYIKIGGNT